MNKLIIKPFLSSAKDVFSMMFDMEFNTQEPEEVNEIKHEDGTVSAKISITGGIKGSLTYNFKEETILELVKIMSDMEFTAVDEFVTSALGEIANIISGNALTTLSEQNMKCDIEPPEIITEPIQEYPHGDITVVRAHSKAGDMSFILVINNHL